MAALAVPLSLAEERSTMTITITEADFKAYEDVRLSGVTNMFDARLVAELSGPTRPQIIDIMENYATYKAKYLGGNNE